MYGVVALTGVVLHTFPDDSEQTVSTIVVHCTLQLRGYSCIAYSAKTPPSQVTRVDPTVKYLRKLLGARRVRHDY